MNGPEAEDPELDREIMGVEPRRKRARGVLAIVALLLSAGLFFIWTQREPIVRRFVQNELAARGVEARYDIQQIAVRTQRIENLVLGNPDHPDLTARSVEVDLAYGAFFPRVAAVRARGVRLYGKLTGNGLELGELDKFRNPESTTPFGMPDINLTLEDGRIRLDTPAGRIGMALEGRGNLHSGFVGKLAALVRNAAVAGCKAPQATAWLDVRMNGGSPRLSGPVRADALRCGDVNVAQLALQGDVTFASALDSWKGEAKAGAAGVRGAGAVIARPDVDLSFSGDASQMTGKGTVRMAAFRMGGAQAGRGEVEADWSWKGGSAATMRGNVDLADINVLDASALDRIAKAAEGTPVAPLAAKLASGVSALQTGNRLRGEFALDNDAKGARVRFSSLDFAGARGSRIALSQDSSLAIDILRSRWALDGGLSVGGGGLPDIAIRLAQSDSGGFSGQMFVQPYVARDARLETDLVRFRAGPNGTTQVRTRLRLDGPMPDGYVRGLDMPVEAVWGRSGFAINPACSRMRFGAFKTGALRLDGTALNLCPVDGALLALRNGRMSGGAAIAQPRLTGKLGETRMALTAQSARYELGKSGFQLAESNMRLGDDDAPILLAAEMLDGAMLARGLGGQADGITARIGTVPLLARDGDARWAYVDGALALKGSIIIHDAANPDRFNPLQSSDFRLTLANGRIDASGSLHLPGKERKVAAVDIRHMLGSGVGHADLAVNDLQFDRQLQPDEVTPLALGVVANVKGAVKGEGRIDWTGDKVTSSGEFTTDGLDLAAAFGPVQRLSTTIKFTDLIGLVTAPGQEMHVASVNPGIEVRDGIIRYALLPGQRAAIESGRWPFAGGELTMLPTVMDFSAEKPRHLTFRVLGLEAGAFIQMLELENVSATGTFDGLLPMVFDAQGGRIEGGILTARQIGSPPLVIDHVEGLDIPCDPTRQAGRLSYVGQVSNEDLGFTGKLAFDALKDLQYKCLTILMDGAIDGEVVTQVAFNGINRGELSSVPQVVAKQFVGLPFIFNIKIEAPFRGLMNTARSFIDPSLLIRQQLGDEYAPVKQNRVAVQPRESETVPSKERK